MTEEGKLDPRLNQHIQHEQSEQRRMEREALMARVERGERPWQEHAGLMSVVTAVRDVEFPASFEQLRDEIGEREVITARDRVYPLEDVLDILEAKLNPDKDPLLEDGTVPSFRDFHEIVQRHWEAIRFENIPDEQKPARGGAQPQDPRTRR
jgi:hypothetical protein